VGNDPEERRVEPRGQREAANEGREGDRGRGQQVPPDLEPTREPSEDSSMGEEPYPQEDEQPRHHGLERSWWRRILRGPREEGPGRSWWRRMFGG
jgi:hypothetical protein